MFPQMYPTDAQPEEAQAATDREINGWLFQSVGSVQVNDAEGDNQSPSKQRQTAQGHQPGCEQAANYVKPAYRSCWYSCQRKMSLRGLLVEDMAAGAARHLVLAEELRSFGNPGMRTRYRVLAGPGMAPSCYFRARWPGELRFMVEKRSRRPLRVSSGGATATNGGSYAAPIVLLPCSSQPSATAHYSFRNRFIHLWQSRIRGRIDPDHRLLRITWSLPWNYLRK